MGVVSKDCMSINLTQCQLPREACTEKALVTGCQGTVWDHTMSLICSLTWESRDVLDSNFGRWTDSQLLKQSLKNGYSGIPQACQAAANAGTAEQVFY